jgi:hypothetical protein
VYPERPQPDRDRLSALTALVLMAYALIRIVELPTLQAEFSVFGLLIHLEFNTRFVMLSLAAALTAAGADWLIRSHPLAKSDVSTYEHWVIPGLAALGVGAILTRIPEGPGLWLGLALVAGLLIAVMVAEFIVHDANDPRHDFAETGLTALAYLLLVGAFFAVRATGLRAAFAIPLVMACSTSVAWRLLRLARVQGPQLPYAVVVGAATAQVAWGLHYWPIEPLRQGLLLGLVTYLGNGFVLAILRDGLNRERTIELVGVAAVALAATLLLA